MLMQRRPYQSDIIPSTLIYTFRVLLYACDSELACPCMPSSADDIKDRVLLTQLIERPLSGANFSFSFN